MDRAAGIESFSFRTCDLHILALFGWGWEGDRSLLVISDYIGFVVRTLVFRIDFFALQIWPGGMMGADKHWQYCRRSHEMNVQLLVARKSQYNIGEDFGRVDGGPG